MESESTVRERYLPVTFLLHQKYPVEHLYDRQQIEIGTDRFSDIDILCIASRTVHCRK